MKEHIYKVRPEYGSNKLLIEFDSIATDKDFIKSLKDIFIQNNIMPKTRKDYIFSASTSFSTSVGDFDLDIDEWDLVFILSENNQKAIEYINEILESSDNFKKVEVNFEDYRLKK